MALKARFLPRLRPHTLPWQARKFLYRVHRRLDRYFNQDDGLMLNQMDRMQRPCWRIGEYSYGHPTRSPRIIEFDEKVNLEIGKFCSFAEDVTVLLGYGYHRAEWVTTYPFSTLFDGVEPPPGLPYARGDVKIGNDVWVCTGATIMSGVTIGNGAVIAAQSVVSKDVPAYTIVAGNPAREVGRRFAPETAARLEALAWWDWPVEKIQRECPAMLCADVEGFLAKHTPSPAPTEMTSA